MCILIKLIITIIELLQFYTKKKKQIIVKPYIKWRSKISKKNNIFLINTDPPTVAGSCAINPNSIINN